MLPFDLSRGAPTLETVPSQALLAHTTGLNHIIEKNLSTLLYKGSTVGGNNFKGYGPLREVLAAQHGVTPEQIIIRNGGMDAMTHVLTYLLWQRAESSNPQSEIFVATEIPTYDRFPQNLHIHGLQWAGVPFGPQGLDLEILEDLLRSKPIKMFYGIYEGQNPSSYFYSDVEMRAVETLCQKYNCLVLWDGAYHRLTYGRERTEIPAPAENVILQRNYTKEISAGLKCGYLVVPKNLAAKFDYIVSNAGLNPNYPTQAWIHAFITSPAYEAHITFLRKLFAPRAQTLVQALREFSPQAQYNEQIDSGYFLEITYPHISDRGKFMQALEENALTVSDSTLSYPPEFRAQAAGKIRFPFAVFTETEIREICQRLEGAAQTLR